jgi:hypothetical protein
MGYRREGMRVNQMVMLKLLLIMSANNLWEVWNLILETKNTILI